VILGRRPEQVPEQVRRRDAEDLGERRHLVDGDGPLAVDQF
jgi:hypothetical protein